MKMKQTARDIMTANPTMVQADHSIAQALAILKNQSISGAPVLDEKGQLCGLISIKDIVFGALWRESRTTDHGYCVVSSQKKEPLPAPDRLEVHPDLKVRDIMTPMVFSISINATINRIVDDMRKGKVHRLVVIEADQVVGIVTSFDLLKVIRSPE